MDMYRVPVCGRNSEYLGEDPYLTGRMATEIAREIQAQGVVATLKHFVCNDEEFHRRTISAEVDERTLREIYLRPFEMAVKQAHPWAVMGAYNRLNDIYCCSNDWLIHTVLKNQWSFNGVLMSDWKAAHDPLDCANAGLDLDMPKGQAMGRDLIVPLIKEGKITQATIDDKVRRILRMIVAMGFINHQQKDQSVPLDDPASDAVALAVARAGTVLLRNEQNLLPLDRQKIKTIFVLGPNADPAVTGIGGSSYVKPLHEISVLDGLKSTAGAGVNVIRVPFGDDGQTEQLVATAAFEPVAPGQKPGLSAELYANKTLNGEPALRRVDERIDFNWKNDAPAPGIGPHDFSIRWIGHIRPPETGRYSFTLASDDGSRLFVDGTLLVNQWTNHRQRWMTRTMALEGGKTYEIKIEYFNGLGEASCRFGWGKAAPVLAESVQKQLTSADAAVVCVGFDKAIEHEGVDRPYDLPAEQVALINAVTSACPRTIVVVNAGGNVAMESWIDKTAALLQAWYPGQDGGRAIAEILFGDVNPSAHLPATFEKRWADSPASANYPGEDDKVYYREGIFMGYRHFDQKGIEPRYPFGFGLSYTTFKLDHLKVTTTGVGDARRFQVSADVTNTGARPGEQVVQIYVGQSHPSVPRPPRELKGFAKLNLTPGQTKTAAVELDSSSLAFWDTATHAWKTAPGEYQIHAGTSSRDLPLEEKIEW